MNLDDWYDSIYLEEEQRHLLARMVDGERSLPIDQQDRFLFIDASGGASLLHPYLGEQLGARAGDLETLVEKGLLRSGYANGGGPWYEVRLEGRRSYAEMKRRSVRGC